MLANRACCRAVIEGARVGGITVEMRDERITLRGMVDSTQMIRAAEDTTRGVPGRARGGESPGCGRAVRARLK